MSVQVRVNGGDRQSEGRVKNSSFIVAADILMAGWQVCACKNCTAWRKWHSTNERRKVSLWLSALPLLPKCLRGGKVIFHPLMWFAYHPPLISLRWRLKCSLLFWHTCHGLIPSAILMTFRCIHKKGTTWVHTHTWTLRWHRSYMHTSIYLLV